MTYAGMPLLAASLVFASAVLPARATSSEEDNQALIARSFDAWREGTGGPYDLLADDVVWTITGNSLAAKTYPSREAFLGRSFDHSMRG